MTLTRKNSSQLVALLKEVPMKIFMTGGTGFVGLNLTKRLAEEGHEVTVLTRSMKRSLPLPQGASYLEGNPVEKGAWQEEVGGYNGVINLAGASIFKRWSDANKREIRNSRVLTTQNLVEAFSAPKFQKPFLFSTSAVGYYGFSEDDEFDETSLPADGFLALLAQEWESAARKAEGYGVRVVLMRFGVVLGKGGGALKEMIPVFKKYLGSPLGTGKQWFSWIHLRDLASVYSFLLYREDISGPVNCTSPQPVRNREMTKALGEVLGKPTFMPALPGFVIHMVLGEFGSVLLKGQRVLPKKLLEKGFHFQFPVLKDALREITSQGS
jgi:uncharacterized protein (TIGR01777 family)